MVKNMQSSSSIQSILFSSCTTLVAKVVATAKTQGLLLPLQIFYEVGPGVIRHRTEDLTCGTIITHLGPLWIF
ncbi:ORF1222 [White spot syndrome virus]|uniref:Wsv052 n=3 Tax=White spot syndrome virus TaxID=342409 RepID=Q8VBB6_WSSVS|nr:wsv052 [Shrimp white spot syndrome virus]AFX59429.1 wsv052 [White spot syndrome virus]AAL33056.1 wsv052 [Shrimp white spot syndrome virus]AAL88977.1 WSSV109 [Shrimp white spot syndrome virus]ATU83962.1 ORF1222 [White spot syndrome virus]AWQ60241.1 wsv052 [Shrimp white spot syndrome virus]